MKVGIALRTLPQWVEEFTLGCHELGLSYKLIDINLNNWLEQLQDIDFFVWRIHTGDYNGLAEARNKIPIIETMGIHCFPSSLMLWMYDNKIRQTFFFQRYQIPAPQTFVGYDEADALEFAHKSAYPLVWKTYYGASSLGVALVRRAADAASLVRRFLGERSLWHKIAISGLKRLEARGSAAAFRMLAILNRLERYVYFQEYLKSPFDLRITTFGENICSAFKRLNRPKDFRASGSGRWEKLTIENLPMDACALALDISRSHKFICMTYDFIKGQQGWAITEISYTFLLNKIYSDTLFQRTGEGFIKLDSVPIGVLCLQAAMAEAEKATDRPDAPPGAGACLKAGG